MSDKAAQDQRTAAPTIITTNQARGGETGHGVRYVLGISLGLAVVAMIIVFVMMR